MDKVTVLELKDYKDSYFYIIEDNKLANIVYEITQDNSINKEDMLYLKQCLKDNSNSDIYMENNSNIPDENFFIAHPDGNYVNIWKSKNLLKDIHFKFNKKSPKHFALDF